MLQDLDPLPQDLRASLHNTKSAAHQHYITLQVALGHDKRHRSVMAFILHTGPPPPQEVGRINAQSLICE